MSLPKELMAQLIKYRKTTDIKPWEEDFCSELYDLEMGGDEICVKLHELSDRINEKLDELIAEL
jgi:hypothetical protein